MKSFGRSWISSKAPRKQRKYRYNAPLHLKHKMVAAHLSEELRKKYKKRSFAVRVGDKVKIMRGEFKGTIGAVEEIDTKRMKVKVAGAERQKGTGQPARKYPLDPSNLKIIELDLKDKERKAALERNIKEEKK